MNTTIEDVLKSMPSINTPDFGTFYQKETVRKMLEEWASLQTPSANQDEFLLDISRFAVSNKKPFDYGRTEDGKDVLNVWVVDIPKVIAYIKSKYLLMPLPNKPSI